jgi:hypothetical protein
MNQEIFTFHNADDFKGTVFRKNLMGRLFTGLGRTNYKCKFLPNLKINLIICIRKFAELQKILKNCLSLKIFDQNRK